MRVIYLKIIYICGSSLNRQIMKRITIILAAVLFSLQAFSVDIVGNFSLSSYGKYYPYEQNGTIYVNFDFVVTDGPITTPFKIGFYLSTDLIIETTDYKIHEFTINSCNNGNSAFPDQFGSAAPYKINQLLKMAGIPKNQTVFFGVILDYANAITETDETNNGGAVNMAPFQVIGNVGVDISFNTKSLTILPNPVVEKAIINFVGINSDNITLKVMDITGRIVSETNNISFPFVWLRGSLYSGAYIFILVRNSEAIIRKKVILN